MTASTEMNLDQAPGWLPVVGEVIVGEVIDVARGWSDFKEAYYPIVTIQTEGKVTVKDGDGTKKYSGPVAVHGFHTVLLSRLSEIRPVVGERIGIKYVSETAKTGEKGKAANSPAIYNVKVAGRGAADVWESIEQDPRLIAAKAKNRQAVADAVGEITPGAPAEDDIPF